jgi:hypothetical protein
MTWRCADKRLNMRTAHGIYRTLQQYVDEADKDGFDEDIDMDFRSVSPNLC